MLRCMNENAFETNLLEPEGGLDLQLTILQAFVLLCHREIIHVKQTKT